MEARTREVLVGMKSELSKGWVQGELQNLDGVCLYGALIRVGELHCGPNWRSSPAVKGRTNESSSLSYYLDLNSSEGKAIVAISDEIGVNWNDLALWQDEPGRTLDDLINVIDRILIEEDARVRTLESLDRIEVRELSEVS